MYSPLHASVGLLLTQSFHDPLPALLVGIASHYALDRIPHGDPAVGPWLHSGNTILRVSLVELADLGLATLIVAVLIAQRPEASMPVMIAGAVGAIVPDLTWGGQMIMERLGFYPKRVLKALAVHHRWHRFAHAKIQEEIPFLTGLLYQSIAIVTILLWRR